MEENAKIAAQKSGRLSFYVVNAIADGCTIKTQGRFISNVSAFKGKRKCVSVQTPKRFFETQRCLFFRPENPLQSPKISHKKPPDIHPTVKAL